MKKIYTLLILIMTLCTAILLSGCDDTRQLTSDIQLFEPDSDEITVSLDNQDFEENHIQTDSFSALFSDEYSVQNSNNTAKNVTAENDTAVSLESENVYIPQSGKKYHKKQDCSNMKKPTEVTLQKASDLGYTPCKRCYK